MIELLSLAFITLLGAMSPGPDFAIVTRYILTGSRKAAFHASFGISLGLLVHVTYCGLGVSLLLIEFPLVFRIIQIAGSCYLGYLGIRLLLPIKKGSSSSIPHPKQSLMAGFFSNLLNPKTTLFIFGIFTQFVEPGTPWFTLVLYGLIISSISLAWFSCLIVLMTHPYFKHHFDRWQHVLMKCMGIVLLGLAITVFIRAVIYDITPRF
jgi:threonine/homoserine/homoserine lactone efflux protein